MIHIGKPVSPKRMDLDRTRGSSCVKRHGYECRLYWDPSLESVINWGVSLSDAWCPEPGHFPSQGAEARPE